ncbi:MAG: HD domain-containing phosphohydrolase [bacterium]
MKRLNSNVLYSFKEEKEREKMLKEETLEAKNKELEEELDEMTEELSLAYEELSLVYDVSHSVGAMLNVDRLPIEVLNKAMNILDTKYGYLMLFDEEDFKLKIKAAIGFEPEKLEKFRTAFKAEEGISGEAVRNGKFIIHDNIQSSKIIHEHILGINNILCVPMKYKDEPIGIITLCDKRSGKPFFAPDARLLFALATLVATTIQNARFFSQLQDLFITTVSSLSSAIDEKDAYTHGHSKRVTELVLNIADALNMSEKDKNILELSARLHDLGKIGVSEAILSKPGKLNDEEWKIMKAHPLKGVKILQPVEEEVIDTLVAVREARLLVPKEDIQNIIPGIKHHHERYDGKGYPDGLQGEDIPLIARIIAVADAFDAMTSKRAYRDAMSEEKALEELRKNAGFQHDPNIVEIFIQTRKKQEERRMKIKSFVNS